VSDEPTMRQLRAPGWVTSLGALAALALGGYNQHSQNSERDEAQRFNEANDTRLGESQRRIWDAINRDHENFSRFALDEAQAREQSRQRTRDEILQDVRREFDVRSGEKHER
jgi:hypothetical protein